MRRVLLSTCLLSAVLLASAAKLAYGADAVLSYAPMPAGPHSDAAGPPAPHGLKHFVLPSGRVCFDPAEAHDKIVSNKLTEPFQALRLGRWQGEALRARLCRWEPEKFVYEIAILRRDGRIVHVYMNAQTGRDVGPLGEANEPDDAQGE